MYGWAGSEGCIETLGRIVVESVQKEILARLGGSPDLDSLPMPRQSDELTYDEIWREYGHLFGRLARLVVLVGHDGHGNVVENIDDFWEAYRSGDQIERVLLVPNTEWIAYNRSVGIAA